MLVGQHDFGRVGAGTEHVSTLLWTNHLGVAFEPHRPSVSCDCLSMVSYSSRVEAGGVLVWKFRLVPAEPGEFRYAATLEGRNGGPTLTALFAVDVVAAVEVQDTASSPPASLVDAVQLQAELTNAIRPVLVDVRPRQRFLLGHVPGSFNLPLHELRGRTSLRRQRLVLVGEGHETDALVAEATGLLSRGYQDLRVLQGGVNRWRARGGALEGTQPRSEQLSLLAPTELMPLLGRPDWLWLSVQDEPSERLPLPAEIVPLTPCARDGLPLAIASRLALSAPLTGIVVTDSQGRGYRDYAARLSSGAAPPVFFVEGGTQALGDSIVMEAHGMTRRTLTVTSGAAGPLARSTSTGGSGGCCGRHR